VSEVTEDRRDIRLPQPRTEPAADEPRRSSVGPWRRAFLTGVTTWGAAEAMYLIINAMFWLIRNEAGPQLDGLLDVWNRWDTGHYVTIASTGYNPANENGAFFPLYPMLMRVLHPVLPGNMLVTGLIVAWLATVAALTVIFRLTEDLLDTATAQRTTLFLMAFPFAFYLCAAYNESLFLALAAASLYCMRRGQWWLAGMWAGLASGTRQAGILLGLAFLIEYLRQRDFEFRRIRWNVLGILLVPTGLIAFMVYSASKFGDPLRFVHIQTFWGRKTEPPWVGVMGTIDQISAAASGGAIFQPIMVLEVIDLLSVPITVALLILSLVGPWRLGKEAWYLTAFSSVSFLLILVSPLGLNYPPLHGVPRYVVEMLPAFMVAARMGANEIAYRFYLLPALGIQSTLLIGYFSGIWLS
jgi:hypothetical protein